MTVIAVKPYIFKRPKLNIKTKAAEPADLGDFEAHISKATVDPNVSIVTWQGGTPDSVFKDITDPDWSCSLELAQDITTAGALWDVLNSHVGETLHFTLTPNLSDTSASVAEFDVIGVPVGMGGQIGAVATSSGTLPVLGQPDFGAAA
ncbi:hypothetical protein [Humibacter ginsenosidimutans]|uniref:Uncharacterized protein n=1 Tax=Humibacter ginsenosidimutans TaxID=2599293 RepID=A0A5B8M343_9MICO|nr:hypothetical protein [Humibacter ginsenosidimutans]QDZ14763.1 hypothetical protein FPZ11_08330 [Humibacter ginsenosidimutans]